MALRAAVANGNWSNPAIWNDGVLPTVGDIVASNNFTVTIDQNINVELITNTVQSPVIATPAMTSNTTPSGIVSASSYFSNNPTFLPFNAFARGGNDWLSNGVTGWLAYQFPALKKINKYQVQAPSNGSPTSVPRNWTFEAWDGSSWVVLDTVTGNSGTATVTRTFTNTTAYIQYRINITLNNGNTSYVGISELYLYEANDYGANTIAGGGFILPSGITLTTTGAIGLSAASTDLITFSSNGTATINCGTGNIIRPTTSSTALSTIKVTGGGTLNVIGNLEPSSTPGATGVSNSRNIHVLTAANATVNVTGRIYGGFSNAIFTDVSCTLNVIGNVLGSTNNGPVAGIWFGAGGTLNVTGNVYGSSSFNNNGYGIYFNVGNLNITGNVYGGENFGSADWGIQIVGIATVYVTGNLYAGNSPTTNNNPAINCTTASYINQVGAIYAGRNSVGFVSSNASAINLLSGPFVCNEYGFVPFQCVRMHLIPSNTSYFEFRDETTNGAVQPGAIAPAARMLQPGYAVDAPTVNNVRFN